MSRVLFLFLVALIALPGAEASEWIVRTDESHLGFIGTQQGHPFEGSFESFAVEICFDPDRLEAAHAYVTVDIASFEAFSAERHTVAMSPDWFAADEHPEITFAADEFRSVGAGAYEAAGTLTVKGLELSMTLPFLLEIDGDVARMSSEVTLLRNDLGLGAGVPEDLVGGEVRLVISLVADRRS